MNFRDHVIKNILSKNDRILEIGPLNRPIAKKNEFPNVAYADIRSTEDIKRLYTSNDYLESTGITIDINEIVDIDYVIKSSYKDTFKNAEKFDAVIVSHVIEHIPDLIGFFRDVARVLKKDGSLIIIYPDARYCFDHFRNGTSFIDAYEVFKKIKTGNASAVFDFTFNVIHENNSEFFWTSSDLLDKLPKNDFEKSMNAYDRVLKGNLPDDVHFWPFSDYQFIKFLYDMNRAGLLEFNIEEFHETQIGMQEYMVVLSPKNKQPGISYANILSKISPQVKNNIVAADNLKLKDELISLKQENLNLNKTVSDLNKTIANIYNSKRYRTIDKIVNLIKKG